jgi:cytochrome oxidase Cu insertion factor (SCO1/SenC/PrrC family)
MYKIISLLKKELDETRDDLRIHEAHLTSHQWKENIIDGRADYKERIEKIISALKILESIN